MTCRAILHSTGKESIPLLLVRSGELTPRQCDHEFEGQTGECPTCKAMIQRADLNDGSSFASAMLALRERGQSVTYRRFAYGLDGSVEPWRVCYWGHPPGYWDGVEFRDCQKASTNTHNVHLEVIKRYYEKQFKVEDGFTIKTEPRLRKPGDPPRPYSPDLAVYGPNDERMVAVEYQRSQESYGKFCDRDDLRRSEKWAAVDWWFDDTQLDPERERATVYTKSQMHRTHLALLSVPFFRCWVDHATLELKADYGSCGDLPPERKARIERKLEKAELAECSTAKIMQQIENGPEREIIKGYVAPLEAKPGSKLNFKKRIDYSLEREKRLALAVVARQKRLEEQDRQHREWEAKQQRLAKERLEKQRLEAERLEQERLDALEKEQTLAFIVRHLGAIIHVDPRWIEGTEEGIAELYQEATDAKVVQDVEKAARAAQQKAEADAAEAEWRAKQERLAIKRQEQWKRDNAERLERERQQTEAESHWHPIRFSEPSGRSNHRFALNLKIGDKVRRFKGADCEYYRGFSSAGYSTNEHTYLTMDGWQVWKDFAA